MTTLTLLTTIHDDENACIISFIDEEKKKHLRYIKGVDVSVAVALEQACKEFEIERDKLNPGERMVLKFRERLLVKDDDILLPKEVYLLTKLVPRRTSDEKTGRIAMIDCIRCFISAEMLRGPKLAIFDESGIDGAKSSGQVH
jgi:hypothetical protein